MSRKRESPSQQTRQKISQALRGKARGIRKKASTAARKGVIKGAGAAGYAAGRGATEIATRPRLADAVGKAGNIAGKGLQAAGKLTSKLPKGKQTGRKKLPKPSLRDQVTAGRATGAFIGGAGRGTYDGLSAAERRNRKKS